MKTLEYIDIVVNPVVEFVLRVLGAFGACWGTFSAVEVVREQLFHGSKDDSLMNNPIYSKVALGVSAAAAGLSTYVLIREKLGAGTSRSTHSISTELDDITVSLPLCSSTLRQRLQPAPATDLESQTGEQASEHDKDSPTEVLCRKKPT